MTDNTMTTTLENVEAVIERAQQTYSRQPRFSEGDVSSIFGALTRWVKLAQDLKVPDYAANSRARDAWLQAFWRYEPHWAGVVRTMKMIVASRGWTMTGGRNQVRAYTNMLYEFDDGLGWRKSMLKLAESFNVADLGAVTELGRQGRGGPLRALYTVDPARCQLSGKPDAPLKYYPPKGRVQEWGPDDFFRVCANPSSQEAYHNLGFSPTSMAYELVKLMYSVWMHDQEKLGARMPEGILLMSGVIDEQWGQALRARKADLDADQRRYFGGLYVLFSDGLNDLDYKLIALSDLPANFDRETFINQTMYGYALIMGMDASEFWPVQYGALGRGRETEVQHTKAMSKGIGAFIDDWQMCLQNHLPPSLQFAFDERDTEGELMAAEVAAAWADVAAILMGSKSGGVPLVQDVTKIESFLVDKGIWPEEWTVAQEESIATDDDPNRMRQARERSRDAAELRLAAEWFPDEPIIRHHWPDGRETVLWDRAGDLLARRLWAKPEVRRQEDGAVLYADPDGEFTITEGDVTRAINVGRQRVGPEFAELLEAEPMTAEEASE